MEKILYFDNIENQTISFPTITEIYKQSIVNAESYFDDCIIMSIKTSNSQEQIEKMEFWKFRNLLRSLNKYLEAENKGTENSETAENFNKNLGEQSKNMMSQSRNMIKTPKIKNQKFK
jgi:hypothetical protein